MRALLFAILFSSLSFAQGVGGKAGLGGKGGLGGGPPPAHNGGIAGTPVICQGTPASCTYVIQSTSNLLLACSLNAAGPGENVSTPTDGKSLTWNAVSVQQTSGVYSQRCWTAIPTSTGSDAVSLASQFGDSTYALVFEMSGVATTSMTDAFSSAAGTMGTMSSGAYTLAGTDVAFGFGFDGSAATPTVGAGWTILGYAACSCLADARVLGEYKLNVTGSQTATSGSTSTNWFIFGSGIKEP